MGVQGEEVFLGNPKDSVWEDWGTEQGTLGHAILTQALFLMDLRRLNVVSPHSFQ